MSQYQIWSKIFVFIQKFQLQTMHSQLDLTWPGQTQDSKPLTKKINNSKLSENQHHLNLLTQESANLNKSQLRSSKEVSDILKQTDAVPKTRKQWVKPTRKPATTDLHRSIATSVNSNMQNFMTLHEKASPVKKRNHNMAPKSANSELSLQASSSVPLAVDRIVATPVLEPQTSLDSPIAAAGKKSSEKIIKDPTNIPTSPVKKVFEKNSHQQAAKYRGNPITFDNGTSRGDARNNNQRFRFNRNSSSLSNLHFGGGEL